MAYGLLPKITLKGREDYESWKFAVEAQLEYEGLWNIVIGEETEPDANKKLVLDKKARARLILQVDPVNYVHIQEEKTAEGVWNKLKNAFDDSGVQRRIGLLRILVSTKLEPCESMEDYVNKIIANAHKLRGAGMDINDEWVAALLLIGLSERYEPMIMAIENSGLPLSSDQIKTKLLQEVSNKNKGETSMYLKNNNSKIQSYTKKHEKSSAKTGKCFTCGKIGQYFRDCYSNRNNNGNKSQQGGRTEKNYSCNTMSHNKLDWYLDSGASAHMTSQRQLCEIRKSFSNTVTVADNRNLNIEGVGDVSLQLNVSRGTKVM